MSNNIYELNSHYPRHFKNGKYLSDFYHNDEGHSLPSKDAVKQSIEKQGIAIIKKANLYTAKDIEVWADIWGEETVSYTGGTNSRQSVSNSILTVGTEPPEMNVSVHNEMSYSYYDLYPRIFMLGCVQAPYKKAGTCFTNNHDFTTDLLKSSIGKKLKEYGVRYSRNYYNQDDKDQEKTGLHSWQNAFGTTDKSIVEKKLQAFGVTHIEWNAKGALYFSYDKPAYEWDDITQTNLSFMSIGNHAYWFRRWKPFCDLQDQKRPHHLTLGNGQELSEEDIKEFVSLGVQNTVEHHWEDGDLVIVDNLRYMHSRKPFKLNKDEKREIYVSMRLAQKRHGIKRSASF